VGGKDSLQHDARQLDRVTPGTRTASVTSCSSGCHVSASWQPKVLSVPTVGQVEVGLDPLYVRTNDERERDAMSEIDQE
jgi:hypothetical protein